MDVMYDERSDRPVPRAAAPKPDKLMNAFSEKDDDMVNSFAANAVYVPK
jgi:hypothetical protein